MWLLMGLMLALSLVARAAEQPAKNAGPELRTAVLSLVAQLGSDELEARDSAEAALVALGQSAIVVIQGLPIPKDPEVAMRLNRVRQLAAIDAAKTIAEVLEMRKHFHRTESPGLAAAAMKKARSLGTAIEFAVALQLCAASDLREIKKTWIHDDARYNAELMRIAADLNICIDLWEAELKEHPGNAEALEKEQTAAMLFYSTRKYLNLSRN